MCLERRHHGLFLIRLQPPVHQADAQFRQLFHQCGIGVLRGLQLQLFRFLDQRTHPVGLTAGEAGFAHAHQHIVATRGADQFRHDRRAAWRQFVDRGNIEVGEKTHRQRTWNRRRTHHQLVWFRAFLHQRQPLADTEAMLFVDHCQAEPLEAASLLEQGMGAECKIGFARGNRLPGSGAFGLLLTAGYPGTAHAQSRERRCQLAIMLFGEDLGRRHEGGLKSVLDRLQAGKCRHHGLATTNIALQQATHRMRLRQIGANFLPGTGLRTGEIEG